MAPLPRVAVGSTAIESRAANSHARACSVVPKICGPFEADGKAYESVRDAKRTSTFFRHRRVRHDGRMFGERLDTPQALGAREDAQTLEHAT